MGNCSATNAPEEMPASVAYFFNGEPMAGKAEKYMGEMVADSHVLKFVGPNAYPFLPPDGLNKEMFGGAAKNLLGSFPDLTFNFNKATPKRNADGSWSADIVVFGTHTGAAFTPMPGKLPPVETTNKVVKIGPETFTLWTDAEGKVIKTEITPGATDGKPHPHGPPGFYAEIGGILPGAAPKTIFCTGEFDPEKPSKAFDGAKMWVQKYEGKQFMKIHIPAGFDWVKSAAPMLPKDAEGNCPQWCPATHFGYLESGEMGIELKDGTKKVIKAGESYLVPPGHRPIMEKEAVMVEFSQDPTWTKAVGLETGAVADTPPENILCQPCEDELGEPAKAFDGAKMWITKGEGKQFMRISIPAGFDWLKSAAPMLPKDAEGNCPQWCPATHFGYLESGEMGIEFKDGSKKLVKAGESYLVGPGHRPIMEKAAVMVEFSQDPTWTKAVENATK